MQQRLRYSMEDLLEPLLEEIIKRISRASDLNSLSLVSKQLYTIEAEHRSAIRVRCRLDPTTEALASLFSRFPNLAEVEIKYYLRPKKKLLNFIQIRRCSHRDQLNNKGLRLLSSRCPSLSDLTLTNCTFIDDTGLGYISYCKNLRSLRLNCATEITSTGLSQVAASCRHLSFLHLVDCTEIVNVEWLEYLGRYESLRELVVKNCQGISQYDLLKFGPGWVNLQKFEFVIHGNYTIMTGVCDLAYNAHYPYSYDICCDNLKHLRLAHIITVPEIGFRSLLGKCKELETLYLEYVIGLDESEMIALIHRCGNLKAISLRLRPQWCGGDLRTPLTDDSLKALALSCPMLQEVELTFAFGSYFRPDQIGFTQKGIVTLIQSCTIRALVINGAIIFDDEGMKGLSSAQFLETLELVDCESITDAGMDFIVQAPCLSSLTLRKCKNVTDVGVAALVRSQKLESLTIIGCHQISLEGVQGAAKTVHYSAEIESHDILKGMNTQRHSIWGALMGVASVVVRATEEG